VDTELYIYCNFNNITVKKEEQACGEKVIMVPQMTQFTIGLTRYSTSYLSATGRLDFDGIKSKSINEQLRVTPFNNDLAFKQMDKFINQMEDNINRRETPEYMYNTNNNYLLIAIICVLVIIILTICGLCYFYCRQRKRVTKLIRPVKYIKEPSEKATILKPRPTIKTEAKLKSGTSQIEIEDEDSN